MPGICLESLIRIGFYILVFFLPFYSVPSWEIGFTLKITDILAGILVILFSLQKVIQWFKKNSLQLYLSDLFWPIVLFISIALLSVIQTYNVTIDAKDLVISTSRNVPKFRSITTIGWAIHSFLVYLLTVNIIKDKMSLTRCLKIYLFSSIIICIYGLYQLFGYLLGFNTGIVFTEARWLLPRISGTFPEPILCANFLLSSIVITLLLFLNKSKEFQTLPLKTFLFLQILVLILTFSLSGWIATSVSILFLFVVSYKFISKEILYALIQTVIAVFISVVLISSFFMPKFWLAVKANIAKAKFSDSTVYAAMKFNELRAHPSGHSQMDRLWLMQAGLHIFKKHPVLGVGIGNFGFHYNKFRPLGAERRIEFPVSASNQYIEILSEMGLLGVIAFLYLVFSFMVRLIIVFIKTTDLDYKSILAGIISIFVGFGLQAVSFPPLFVIYIWVLAGMGMATIKLSKEKVSD